MFCGTEILVLQMTKNCKNSQSLDKNNFFWLLIQNDNRIEQSQGVH